MKNLKIDEKNNFVSVTPENIEDLWNISRIIEKKDVVSGKTTRKVLLKSGKTERIPVFARIQVETWLLEKYTVTLKITGKIIEGKPEEFMPVGSSQSISFQTGQEIKIKKQKIKSFQKRILENSVKNKKKVFVLIIDDEAAELFTISNFQSSKIFRISSRKTGKYFNETNWKQTFFERITASLKEKRIEKLLVAGPGFEKNNLVEHLKEKKIGIKTITENTSHTGRQGLREVLSKQKLENIFKEFELQQQTIAIEELLKELGKNSGLTVIGEKETLKAIEARAIKKLFVLDSFLFENPEKTGKIMELSEKMHALTILFNSKEEPGKKLHGLGGIAGILSFKIH